MHQNEAIAAEKAFIVQTYVRPGTVFVRGEGVHLYDTVGKRYLDMMAGIAVTALGHSDEPWASAVAEQARTLTHVSNLFYTEPQGRLARRLVEHSFADRVFFCNSGSEANETALKFARKYARTTTGRGDKIKFVAFSGGFHGRTMGALSVTAREKYRTPFEPLIPGVQFAPFNDLDAAGDAIDDTTCAVIVEPLQGEGGVNVATLEFLSGLRDLCDRAGALLIFDEVQCGLGRTGALWASESYGVAPDLMSVAKPLAGGLPIGVTLMRREVAEVMNPGDHGSTFAGGPLICRAAEVVFDRVNQSAMLESVRQKGDYLLQALRRLESPLVQEVRGKGLLIGVALTCDVRPLLHAARERGLLVINAGENVLRLCPPLIIETEHLEEAVSILGDCLATLEESGA